MKKTLFIIGLLTITFVSKSQNLIINDTLFTPGIYKTFEEFKTNNPSIEFKYDITTKSRGYGILGAAGKVNFYRINIDKKVGKSIGEIFGFCDGKYVFINENEPKLSPKSNFKKIEYFGKYCYFKDLSSSSINTGTGGSSTTISLDEKLIDIYTGEVIHLTKKSLREIIRDDADLLNQFDNESQKNNKLKDYIILYLEKK